ncbi:MAG: NAD(P)/FAD-dependent oxidoreductase [Fibrobacter sp.]|jgi:predicted Rossmann fold flavoprotein|nr:NAD(P)/FAD-dependent oxidoreductase [Fibrobacter sp.]
MKVVIAGGGAAGFFAAISCKEQNPLAEVMILESSSHLLEKVLLSGGKRCNLTNAQPNLQQFCSNYPRGGKELISIFHRFSPEDTIKWFNSRGVPLKQEPDGRMFPQSNRSHTIVDCLLDQARMAGVNILLNHGLLRAAKIERTNEFELTLTDQSKIKCNCLIIATGGTPGSSGITTARSLGHTINNQIPSLFAFVINDPIIKNLPGITIPDVIVSIASTKYQERGAVLITHNGLSGPAVLRLSSFAARELYDRAYNFTCIINWLPGLKTDEVLKRIISMRKSAAPRKICALSPFELPSRLWQSLAEAAGCEQYLLWANLSRKQANSFAELLYRCKFEVIGKDTNRSEFVTCGGVKLSEINFQTMESRICPGLFFAGEVLDIDGVTGGFNLQAAWSTGYVAGISAANPKNT